MTETAAARPPRRLAWVLGAVALVVVVGIGISEALGWPFLARPMQQWLSKALDRQVAFGDGPNSASTMRFGLLGSIRAEADTIVIGAPAWSNAPHMLRMRDAELKLRYLDLWRAYRGEPLLIQRLKASEIDGQLERLADGRASWQFRSKPLAPDAAASAPKLPQVRELQVTAGTLAYNDALMAIDLAARFSLSDGVVVAPRAGSAPQPPAAEAPLPSSTASRPAGLKLTATGKYGKLPIQLDASTAGVLPMLSDDAANFAMPVTVNATVGRVKIVFDGTATDAVKLAQLRGRFSVDGPSLPVVGDPLGVTLPSTPVFHTSGLILKEGDVWNAVVEQATIGSSRMAGAFTFDTGRKQPLLSGRLTGSRLQLADLGPAIGKPPPVARKPAVKSAKVLPDRQFDLPALRAMDANVLIDIDNLDLGSTVLQPLRPLRTHLILKEGVLTLSDIDARTSQGRVAGLVQLDGRNPLALWKANLRWEGVRLEQWIKQARADGAPPYVSGRFNGQATLVGQGTSTASILASLKGGVRMYLLDGRISHLAVEAAGLDVAQSLGVMIKGDDALPIDCSVADLVADRGLLSPRVLVLDTPDSLLWVDGNLSLATEAMDLRVVVTPKDFSPFALRTPIRLRGSLSSPKVSVEAGKLGARVGAAALLALVNPLAAVLPFMDTGSDEDARNGAAKCQALAQRKAGKAPVSPEAAPAVMKRIATKPT